MRIALVSYDVQRGGGQGRVNYELTRSLLASGHSVSLFTAEAAPDLLEAGAVWVPVVPKARRIDLFRFYEFARRANAALPQAAAQNGAFDIIHGCGFSLTIPHHVNSSHFVHDAWGRSPVHTSRFRRDAYGAYQWAFTALNARWEKRAYNQAARVVAVSENVRRELIASGVGAERIEVIFNGVDTDEFQPGTFDRAALGLTQDVPLALFAGELQTPRKNLDTVLRALTQIPHVHLAVAGETAGSPFPALAAQLGIASRVHFLGYRRDVADLMRASDVFVFPSRYEACSLVLLEAVASGLPVLTARTTGGAEALGDTCSVRLENSDDADALAAALKQVLFDAPRLQAMKQAARAISLTMRWQDMGERYQDTYTNVLSGARA